MNNEKNEGTPDFMLEDEDFHDLPPVAFTIISKYFGEKPSGKGAPTWSEIADEAGFSQHTDDSPRKAHNAKTSWAGFKMTERGKRVMDKLARMKMELRAQSFDEKGNIRSETFKRPQEDNLPEGADGRLIGWTGNPHGKGVWPRFKVDVPPEEWMTDDQLERFRQQQADLVASGEHRSLLFEPDAGAVQNWVILGCVHVPGHNRWLWEGILQMIREMDIHGIILAGDFLDMKSLSSHEKGKKKTITLWDEYLEGSKAIMELEDALPTGAERVFLYGNHEDRYLRTLENIENNSFGQALISPEAGIGLDKFGWKVLTNWKEDYVLIGNNLEVFHGQYLGDGAARKHLKLSSSLGRSCLYFHTHLKDFATNGTFTAWNGGFLGDMDSDYFKYVSRHTRQRWENSFGFVSIDRAGNHHVSMASCLERSFVLNGRSFPH